MNPALRCSSAHVFVESIEHPALTNEDDHHLCRVLRLRHNEAVSVSDGAGRWRLCRIDAVGGLQADGAVERVPSANPPVAVGFALPKGDRPEWIVQKLTEIGVDRIIVLYADRNVARWDASKTDRQMDRLRRIAREASMQSRRVVLPDLIGPLSIADLVRSEPGAAFAEPGGDRISLAHPTVLIGPEGGWTPTEMAAAQHTVALGSTILRVDTAAVVAGAQLAALRDHLSTLR